MHFFFSLVKLVNVDHLTLRKKMGLSTETSIKTFAITFIVIKKLSKDPETAQFQKWIQTD